MKLKEEFNQLLKTVKDLYKSKGEKVTNEEIARKMGLSRSYFSGLLGGSEEVKQKHIDDFKAHFSNELQGVVLTKSDKKVTPERALVLAMLQDYAEWKAEETGQTFDQVKESIRKKASLILADPESWLPDQG